MEDLNKTQIILLTLLVSFVTSIATGIVTVSLFDNAPPSVTQTINKVVERTVEKVIPGEVKSPVIVTKEVPVNNEDLIVAAVQANSKSLVRIKDEAAPLAGTIELGLVVSKDGVITSPFIPYDPNRKLIAVFSDGKSYPLLAMQTTKKTVSLFKTSGDSVKDKYVFTPASLGDSDNLNLGQSVISLGGSTDRNFVGVGVISGITMTDSTVGTSTPKKIPSLFETNLNASDGASGFYLLNLSGQVIGLHLGEDLTVAKNFYTPMNRIKDEISSAASSK